MTSRFEATLEHVWKDRASPERNTSVLGAIGDISAKAYDAISGIAPSVIGIFSSKEFKLAPRDGITSGTRAAISNTLNAQWFKSGPGRILNFIPKALTAIVELPDGIIRDGIQVVGGGERNDGYVVRTA